MRSPNLPLNIPALEAAIVIHDGSIPSDIQELILASDYNDDLSGLRLFAHNLQDTDGWGGIQRPKQEIGDYVESEGIKVPRRYGSLNEALTEVRSGKTILVRSEHPDEYDKFSGLLDSYRIDQKILDEGDEPLAKYIAQGLDEEDVLHYGKRYSLDDLPMKRYLQLTGVRPTRFYDEMSYSFCEFVPGTNVMVVADDAIEGRYHITARRGRQENGWVCNGEGVPEEIEKQYTNIEDFLDNADRKFLIEQYETIRQLPKFSVRQCPIMELQIGEDDTIWFLQYHKSRPFRASPLRLDPNDYPESEGWLKAQGTRGALGSFVAMKSIYSYPPIKRNGLPDYIPEGPEDASFDVHGYVELGHTEFAARTRAVSLLAKGIQSTYKDMADGRHELRSRWFKPSAAMSLGRANYNSLVPRQKQEELFEDSYLRNRLTYIALNLASDGLTGYIRLDPESQE